MIFKLLVALIFCTSAQIPYFPFSLSVCLWQWQAVLVCLCRQHERVLTCPKINLRFVGGREPQCMWLWCTAQCFGCASILSLIQQPLVHLQENILTYFLFLAGPRLDVYNHLPDWSSYSAAFFCFYTTNVQSLSFCIPLFCDSAALWKQELVAAKKSFNIVSFVLVLVSVSVWSGQLWRCNLYQRL